MANWSKNKVDSSTINGGNEFTTQDNLAIDELNAIVNNSFYASNISENVANQLSNLAPNDKIEFKGSNPNLLINGDFRVNQRGATSYTEVIQYTVDRWRTTNTRTTVTVTETGITLSANSTGAGYIWQKIEDGFKLLKGKTITLSISVDNVIYSGTGAVLTSLPSTGNQPCCTIAGIPNASAIGIYLATNGDLICQIGVTTEMSINVEYIKLEIGSVATAHSLRPYAEELALCQRYYIELEPNVVFAGRGNSTTTCSFAIPLPVTSRSSGSINISDLVICMGGVSVQTTSFSIQSMVNVSNGKYVTITATDVSTMNYRHAYNMYSTAKITLDAEMY